MSLYTYEKEMLALVKSVKKWRPYILGKPFLVRTDQRSPKYLLEQRIITPYQQKWFPKLMGFDYKVEDKKGMENFTADSLSRKAEFHYAAISMLVADWWENLKQEVFSDSFYTKLEVTIDSLPLGSQKYVKRDGVWLYKNPILLSPHSSLIPKILASTHASLLGGHYGLHKSLAMIRSSFHWQHMQKSQKLYPSRSSIALEYS